MKREFDLAESMAQAIPDLSSIFVFADESGKTDKFLIIGSLWVYSVNEHRKAASSLHAWRRASGHRSEMHFKRLKSIADADAAIQFFDSLLTSTPLHAFKALIARNDLIPSNRRQDALYQGFGEMIIDGVKSELSNNRLAPPFRIHLTKDADQSTDVFKLRELNRRLVGALNTEFPDSSVELDNNKVKSIPSSANNLIQISDLYTGSLNKWLNQEIVNPVTKPKDKFATHVGSHFKWRFDGDGRLISDGDVCEIIYLNDPGPRQLGA